MATQRPRFIYQLEFRVKTYLGKQWADGVKAVIAAHNKHDKGQKNIELYTTYVGDGDVAFLRIPISSLGELDSWVHNPQIVLEQLGDGKGQDLLSSWAESFESWSSRILMLSEDGH